MNAFENFKLSQQLLDSIRRLGYDEPTQIQKESIPPIMAGKDVIGESATGSGKTLAFGCGIIENTMPGKGLQSLVLTPTRELAEQVKNSLRQLSYNKPLRIITAYGGVAISPQIRELSRTEVLVATPGRLLDHLERRTVDISKVKILVLDEADRMLDMGFIDDVQKIIRACPANRQTMFFSATISSYIKELGNRYMRSPVQASAVKMVDPSKLKQVYYNISKDMKLSLLIQLLQQEKSELVMVFCNSRRTADFVTRNLKVNGVRAIAIHGGFSQNKRNKTMQMFNEAKVQVLVCTDVASRGLHIDNVTHVYNYEIPKDSNDYVHRIGRTARAGEKGKVINVLSEFDHDNFARILRDYRSFTIDMVQPPQLKRVMVVKQERQPYSGRQSDRPAYGRPTHRRPAMHPMQRRRR